MGERNCPVGYSPKHLAAALHELDLIGFSDGRIRKYALDNGLSVTHRMKSGAITHLIPEGNLDGLIDGMGIPVRSLDLYNSLQEVMTRIKY